MPFLPYNVPGTFLQTTARGIWPAAQDGRKRVAELFEVRKLAPGVHVITELGQSHAYLVEGEAYAALIDTGMGIGDIRAVVEALTSRPVIVLNTHTHWDHVGGNHRFEYIGVHPAEAENLQHSRLSEASPQYLRRLQENGHPFPPDFDAKRFQPQPSSASFFLEHGQEIDLGGRQLIVWHTPGHSPGSVCFVEEVERLMFAGDTVYEGPIYLHLPGSDPQAMLSTLQMLSQLAWEINLLMPGHGLTPTDGRLLQEAADGLRRTFAGEVPLKKGVSIHSAVRVAAFSRVMFFLPADWRPPQSGAPAAG